MASEDRLQRKRKSAELGQVFEVSEADLSPEEANQSPEGAEPPIKLPRTSEAARPAPNLKVADPGGSPPGEQIQEISDDSSAADCRLVEEPSEVFLVVDSFETDEAPVELNGAAVDLAQDGATAALEEGEVNDDPPAGKAVQISVKFCNQAAADRYQQAFGEFLAGQPELEVERVDGLTLHVYSVEGGAAAKPKKRRKKKRPSETEGLFVVDATPSPAHQRPPALRYQSSKLQIHQEPPEEQKSGLRAAASCFNCAEPHDLRSCPHPRNFQTINANRQKFLQRTKVPRYHLGDAVDPKFGHFKPGTLTARARKALRLKRSQLPSFIYKMRIIGYPPGWLEEAKTGDDSELEMFDIEGRHVERAAHRAAPSLDPDKIVDYPGFNVPLEKPFRDEYKYYRVAPYSDKFHKKHMIEAFRLQAQQQLDMDGDVQKQKASLIAEIQRAAETVPWATEANEPAGAAEATEPAGADESARHSVRESVFGTPILKSENSFTRLPAADNFTKGVSAVIDFENLPNSTGKYEQMSDMLKKVRSTMKTLSKS
uniref:PSP proline-rich domain-containing protein n=1 Tax=Dendroctonus ponderosae TaxID=77166 RepID=A0AAR5Q0F3_DENPD